MTQPKHAWMVRAGDDNELADLVWEKNAVAIGWRDMGDVSHLRDREQIKARYRQVYPDDSKGRVLVNAGQIHRFAHQIQEGDYILTYVKASRELLIGLAGPYVFRTDLFPPYYPHVRPVQWLRRVPRDRFTAPARNSMGSTLTVFGLDEHLDEIHLLATQTGDTPSPEEFEEEPPFYEEVKSKADELIADLISRLDPYEFQDLVAGVLRAMGFRAVSNPPGRDRGIDIVACRDALGFERPRVKVQVKHRSGAVSGPDMRAFIGALREGDNGLDVATGGFSQDAQREAERSREPLTLLDRDQFIDLLLEYYENLDPAYRARVPLRKVWLPAE